MLRLCAMGLALAAIIGAAETANVPPARAAADYCPNPTHREAAKVPADLVGAVARTFSIDAAAVRDAAFVRCVGPRLMACSIGANLDCFKADTRRVLPGATAWCREHPGSKDIPMVATGHDTIYAWSCRGRRAVAGAALQKVDAQGYIADNWKDVR